MSPAWLVSLCCSIPDGWPVHDGQRTYRLSNTKRLCNDIFCQSSCSRPQAISLDGPLPSQPAAGGTKDHAPGSHSPDRKSTRLNSSHVRISYAVFCLKKKKYSSDTRY